jgi:Ca-activated chloride channel family protein
MKFFRISLLVSLFCSAVFSADLYAQGEPPPLIKKDDEVLKINTQLVEVPIVVTDKSGNPLRNLKQTNFIVFEDGKPQEITEFTTTNAPFEVVLLLDTSGSTRSDLRFIKLAAAAFISSLRAGDRVAILAFNTARDETRAYAVPEILTNLTDDRTQLQDALDRVSTSNGTPYYDSLLQITEKIFKNEPNKEFRGRRAIVALTDGVDSTSEADFAEASEELGNTGVVTYFIQVNTREFFEAELLGDCEFALRFSKAQIRRYYRTFFPRSKVEQTMDFCQIGDFERLDMSKRLYWLANEEMKKLAQTSGGKIFAVGDVREAKAAFISVAEEIGTKYSLGYYSTNEKRDGKYRQIKVELKGIPAGASVRAREGYTAPIN